MAIARLMAAAFCVLIPVLGQPLLTTIQDVLYKADGTRFDGLLMISWNSFESANQSNIVQHTMTVKLVNGKFRAQHVPTTDSNPPT